MFDRAQLHNSLYKVTTHPFHTSLMYFECTTMSSISPNHIKLFNLLRFDEVTYLINIKATSRGAEDCASLVMNIFHAFSSEIDRRCLYCCKATIMQVVVCQSRSHIMKRCWTMYTIHVIIPLDRKSPRSHPLHRTPYPLFHTNGRGHVLSPARHCSIQGTIRHM